MQELEGRSHFQDLLNIAVDKDNRHKRGVAVSTIPSLMQRSDGQTVFEEGEAFSGIESQDGAEACLTMVAAPHVKPQISKDRMLSTAKDVLSQRVSLPNGMSEVDYVSPQVIVWFRNTTGQNQEGTDVLALFNLGYAAKQNFTKVIARQAQKAIRLIERVSGKPTIWGSWGHGTPDERKIEGRSRGLPTNKFGHFHVTHFDLEKQDTTLQDNLSATEKLNHFVPWNLLLQREFGVALANFLHKTLPQDNTIVEPFSESLIRENGTSLENHGYILSFLKPVNFEMAFAALIQIAGESEKFYQEMSQCYEDYYKCQSNNVERVRIMQEMMSIALTRGFTHMQAKRLTLFVIAIRPTYGQLMKWERELSQLLRKKDDLEVIRKMKSRYERARKVIGENAQEDKIRVALFRDSLMLPEDFRVIERTFSVHSTLSFIIEDYDFQDGELKIASIKLLPSVASTEAGPEHIVGAVLKRSQGI